MFGLGFLMGEQFPTGILLGVLIETGARILETVG